MKHVKESTLALIGAPFKFGQPKNGVNLAPDMLKKDILTLDIEFSPVELIDLGNIQADEMQYNDEQAILNYNVKIANLVQEKLEKGFNILTIGGDHTIAIGSINGVFNYNPDTIVIWVDAHADINTKLTSPSGNMHGMPVAYLTGLEKIHNHKNFNVLQPKLNFDRIAYIGIRDLDEDEKKILKEHKILAYWIEDVKKIGIQKIMTDILSKLDPNNNKNIHLSFDIDGIDPIYAPSTGTVVEKGLTENDIFIICKKLKKTQRLRSMDIVEINPMIGSKGDNEKTLKLAMECIKLAMIDIGT